MRWVDDFANLASAIDGLPPKAVLALPNTSLHVRPLRPPMPDENAKEDEFNPLAANGSLPALSSSVMEKFAAAQAHVSDRVGRNSPASGPGDDVVVTPLGTGSALPTKMRNGTSLSWCMLRLSLRSSRQCLARSYRFQAAAPSCLTVAKTRGASSRARSGTTPLASRAYGRSCATSSVFSSAICTVITTWDCQRFS